MCSNNMRVLVMFRERYLVLGVCFQGCDHVVGVYIHGIFFPKRFLRFLSEVF